ncbi:hypothetical protein [Pseudomonas sp.]
MAAKAFEADDPELSDALMDAFFIADQMARGLKVQRLKSHPSLRSTRPSP